MQSFIVKALKSNHSFLLGSYRPLLNSAISKAVSSYKDTSFDKPEKVSRWMKLNEKVYPPQDPNETPRPAFVCHELKNLKYSPKKMWYVACFVRGMSVDEAMKQLDCIKSKGALIVKDAIQKTVDMAMKDHNVEFRSNLWVAESFSGKGSTFKGIRRNAKGKITVIRYRHCHYYLRLEEGQPPEDYYCKNHLTSAPYLLDKWFTQMRSRKILSSL